MPLRPDVSSIVLLAGLVLSGPAQALSCRSGLYAGTIEFRCSQPENIASSCRWSATLEAEDGSSGTRSGTFLLPPRAKDLVVVSENRLGGKKIVRGQVKLEGCAIGLVGPAASDAARELARQGPALQGVAPQSSAPSPSRALRQPPAGARAASRPAT
jgi:hypothetical protein